MPECTYHNHILVCNFNNVYVSTEGHDVIKTQHERLRRWHKDCLVRLFEGFQHSPCIRRDKGCKKDFYNAFYKYSSRKFVCKWNIKWEESQDLRGRKRVRLSLRTGFGLSLNRQRRRSSTLRKGVEVENCMLCIKDSKSTPWAESKGPGESTADGK